MSRAGRVDGVQVMSCALAVAVKRAVLKLSNVLRAVLVRVDPFSFHAAGLGRALIGREGVHGAVSLWLPGGTTGLGLPITGSRV